MLQMQMYTTIHAHLRKIYNKIIIRFIFYGIRDEYHPKNYLTLLSKVLINTINMYNNDGAKAMTGHRSALIAKLRTITTWQSVTREDLEEDGKLDGSI